MLDSVYASIGTNMLHITLSSAQSVQSLSLGYAGSAGTVVSTMLHRVALIDLLY